MVNNIRNNTISEISAKKGLNEIKNAEIIKYKKRTPKHQELLNLFNDLLDTILTDKTLMWSKDENAKENEKENANDKTLMSSNDDNENKNENEKTVKTTKKVNDDLDEIINKSKSFEDQIKVENIIKYCHYEDYGDNELKFKYFKIELAHLSNIIDEKLFEQLTFETLANKLINSANKEENQIIVKNIEKNKDRLYEMDPFYDYVIQPSSWRVDLIDAIDFILDFDKAI